MALAETANLAVNLTLGGNFNSGLTQAESGLGRFNAVATTGGAKAGILSGAFGGLGRATGAVGGALSHAGNQLKNIITGPLGMIGLAGGLFTLGGALTASIGKVEEFGASLEKVQTLTGETALASGALIIQFQKFGLGADRIATIVGFAEKTLGKLNTTAGAAGSGLTKLQELDAKFGLQLVDSSGKVADFSTVLEQLATFYDSGASASTKAYVASLVLGRGYTQLIPVLNEGAAGIRAAAEEAKALGLGSTNAVAGLAKFHDQMHNLDEQVNLLQLSIGMALLPTLIDLSKAATDFMGDPAHRAAITNFFKNVVSVGKTAAGAIGDFGRTILGWWNMVPPDLRDLFLKGIVADRTVKFLFGFSPIGAVLSGLQNAVTAGLGQKLGTGIASTLLGGVQKVFVVNPGFGGAGGGLPGVAGAAGGGFGLLGSLAGFGIAAAGLFALSEGLRRLINPQTSGNPLQQRNPMMDYAHQQGLVAPSSIGATAPSGHAAQVMLDPKSALALANTAQQTRALSYMPRIAQSIIPPSRALAIAKEAMRRSEDRLARIAAKREVFAVTNHISVSTSVSVTDVSRTSTIRQTYRTSTGTYMS